MKGSKQSITLKVIIGYFLVATLAAVAVWFVYSQVKSYTTMAAENISSNKKLYLVGDAATNLYEAESLSRHLIQSGETEEMEAYKAEIDTVRATLDSLRQIYGDTLLSTEIDSINVLLTQKTANLEELLALRTQEGDESYYSKVIAELQNVHENLDSYEYSGRFEELEPYQRRVLVKLLEYSKQDNAERISNQSVDSLMNSVKSILMDFEQAERRYRRNLREKENELLANEIDLNGQLRNLLSTIETKERQNSLRQVTESQKMVRTTSQIIAILGATSLLVIFIFLFLVVRDVSSSQRYRKELENAKKYAEALLKSREQLMATVTHDLRSPLNTVAGYTALLEKSKLDSPQSNYVGHIKKSSDFILRLVNDLLDLSKLEAGKMSIDKLPFNPKELIEDTVQNSVPAEKPKNVAVEISISKELDRSIISDPFRIKQILTNLVSNACKFTEEGKIEVKADFLTLHRKKFLQIEVTDTGIGISAEKREEIFEEFSQEDNSIEKRFGGSGLGLAISKKLTHLLHGSIHLKSESGKGSQFTVKIPIKLAEQKTSSLPTAISEQKENIKGFSILIVDDEPAQLGLLSEFIKTTGMYLETCENGEEAIKKLESGTFDLVLTDIQMPKMNGFELLDAIRKDPKIKSLPVIALSGRTDVDPSEYIQKGFAGSLLKPYSSSELLKIIAAALEVDIIEKQVENSKSDDKLNYSLEDLKMFAGGDTKALNTILSAFIESTKNNIIALKNAHLENDQEKISGIAHKMLPMFRQIKATQVVEQLEILENGKSPRSETTDPVLLVQEINELMRDLTKEIKD